jgi:hypothetical protein
VCPPFSQIGPVTPEQRQQIIRQSVIYGTYEKTVDRESAYERLKTKVQEPAGQETQSATPSQPWYSNLPSLGGPAKGGRRGDTLVEAMAKSAARTIGSSVGRQIVRGVLGSLLGGSRR